ncbi:hypothetical protein NDU88_001121 [Pleurodeles waltl]|uniref:Reverse transcriptase domain-containing protein n=1 Tax=Pleurodeles waltl TaxID=8319 RepID=A0AAV7M058_PLEWA|nr:hypothetical protein NDU88_001121 [Pleurodeles waltl]
MRLNGDIKGLRMGSREQKLALYNDDVMIVLADPKATLPPLMGELKRFKRTVGFKINQAKSSIINITLPKVDQTYLDRHFPFTWVPQGVTYLGPQILQRWSAQ